MNDLKVCWWPTDKPIAYSRNSRKIPERAIDKVAASIKEFGWRQAIVVDKDAVIILMHTTLPPPHKNGRIIGHESSSSFHLCDDLLHARPSAVNPCACRYC